MEESRDEYMDNVLLPHFEHTVMAFFSEGTPASVLISKVIKLAPVDQLYDLELELKEQIKRRLEEETVSSWAVKAKEVCRPEHLSIPSSSRSVDVSSARTNPVDKTVNVTEGKTKTPEMKNKTAEGKTKTTEKKNTSKLTKKKKKTTALEDVSRKSEKHPETEYFNPNGGSLSSLVSGVSDRDKGTWWDNRPQDYSI